VATLPSADSSVSNSGQSQIRDMCTHDFLNWTSVHAESFWWMALSN